jgi:F0F1-type ATP synthase membrane subunit b/b'
MKSAKWFLLAFFVVYMAGAIAWAAFFGPPGLSPEYLERNKADHEQYLDVTKSDWYKLYCERPLLHPPENERQKRQAAFVSAYIARPDFIEESRRAAIFHNFFEFYNAIAVVVIAVRFGKKPLLAFVDQQISDVRARMAKARTAREASETRRGAAQAKADGLAAEKTQIDEQAAQVIAEDARAIEEAREHILAQIDEETEERKRLEKRHAAMRLKEELVDQAIADLTDRLKASPVPDLQSAMLEQFVRGLEKTK